MFFLLLHIISVVFYVISWDCFFNSFGSYGYFMLFFYLILLLHCNFLSVKYLKNFYVKNTNKLCTKM